MPHADGSCWLQQSTLGYSRNGWAERVFMMSGRSAPWWVAFVTCGALASDVHACVDDEAHPCVDDYEITISSPSAVAAKRQQLITYLWPSTGFPTTASELVNSNVASPIAGLDNLERVEQLRTPMPRSNDSPVVVTTYHFIANRSRERLAVVVQGHGCPVEPAKLEDYFDDPTRRTVQRLLQDGYSVMTIFMPLVSVPTDSTSQCTNLHAGLLTTAPPGSNGMAYFLEPTAKSLNYAVKHYPSYRDFSMIGLSGGGWTTTVYAAIDTRIKTSIPIAGSVPLYLRKDVYSHDREQIYRPFYEIAGYPDLYVLGSYGTGRQQLQVLNRDDNCCFGSATHDMTLPHVADKPPAQRDFESSVRLYEARVQAAVKALGSGSFRLNIEESPHTISEHALLSIVQPALNGGSLALVSYRRQDEAVAIHFSNGVDRSLCRYSDRHAAAMVSAEAATDWSYSSWLPLQKSWRWAVAPRSIACF